MFTITEPRGVLFNGIDIFAVSGKPRDKKSCDGGVETLGARELCFQGRSPVFFVANGFHAESKGA
jgi:hypothetical protein